MAVDENELELEFEAKKRCALEEQSRGIKGKDETRSSTVSCFTSRVTGIMLSLETERLMKS